MDFILAMELDVFQVYIIIFELSFYQDQNRWRYELLLIEIGKNIPHKIVDLLVSKNNYVLIRKLYVFLSIHNCKFVLKRQWSSNSSQNVLIKHKQRCEKQ